MQDDRKIKIDAKGDKLELLNQLFGGNVPTGVLAALQGGSDRIRFSDEVSTALLRQGGVREGLRLGGEFQVECFGQDGNLKWEDSFSNIVTTEGIQHILDILFVSATAQIDPFYVALIADNSAGSTVIAADTMASHAGWTEDANYSEGVRQTYVDVRSVNSVSNTDSKAAFSINGTTTLAGAFLTSDNTKSGSTGTLLSGGNFTGGDRAVENGDTLNVTYTFTGADDGV